MPTIERLCSEDSALCQRSETFPGDKTWRTRATINDATDIFESHRSRLFGIAYRMLGRRADAEDVLQDAYLRWQEAGVKDIESPIGFLIAVTTRLCLDRLRALKKEREQYTGAWLPESIVMDYVPSPETQFEIAGDVRVAFLAALERLGPEEWAAFLLHEVFDYDYPEVARMVGKSEAACRQLICRSRAHLCDSRARFAVTPECYERALKTFLAAIGTGDRQAVLALLAEKVEYIAAHGGGCQFTLEVADLSEVSRQA